MYLRHECQTCLSGERFQEKLLPGLLSFKWKRAVKTENVFVTFALFTDIQVEHVKANRHSYNCFSQHLFLLLTHIFAPSLQWKLCLLSPNSERRERELYSLFSTLCIIVCISFISYRRREIPASIKEPSTEPC